MKIFWIAMIYIIAVVLMMAGPGGGEIEVTKGIVYCEYCPECEFYEGVCPNDVRDQTGFQQMDNCLWVCPQCAVDFKEECFPERLMEEAEYRMDSLMDR